MDNVKALRPAEIFSGEHWTACAAQQQLLRQELDNALREDRFLPVYQPKVSLSSGRLVGAEALIRLQTVDGAMIRPDLFIPFAEFSGQIGQLDQWMIQRVCRDIGQQLNNFEGHFHVAINLSAADVLDMSLVDRISRWVSDCGLKPENVHIELTETALITRPVLMKDFFAELQKRGFEIWLDDFGTGYASISLLREYRVDGIKIDKSFVDNIVHNLDDFTICSAVVALAQRLGLGIVAEGIETEEQLQLLTQMGCDTGQGYLFSKPLPLAKLAEQWLPMAKSISLR